jgi:protein SCO1/2
MILVLRRRRERSVCRRVLPASILILAVGLTPAVPAAVDEPQAIGIEERLGDRIPLDLVFRDEEGKSVALGDVIDGPTVLSLVYYGCPGICPALLNGVVWVVNRAPSTPGEDYRLVTVSFDPGDTPEMAQQQRQRYLSQLKKPVAQEGWRFLTGDEESITKLTDAVGYRFRRDGSEFLHPTTLVVLSPSGKIARYLYGVSYQPFDLQMALLEASEERTGPTIAKMVKLCFSYDPEGRRYVANVTRIGMAATLVLAVAFVAVVVALGKKDKRPVKGGNKR